MLISRNSDIENRPVFGRLLMIVSGILLLLYSITIILFTGSLIENYIIELFWGSSGGVKAIRTFDQGKILLYAGALIPSFFLFLIINLLVKKFDRAKFKQDKPYYLISFLKFTIIICITIIVLLFVFSL
jgi:hypothetical protein